MKKALLSILSLILSITILQIICFAVSDEGTTFYYENEKEITVFGNTLNYSQKKEIADYFAYDNLSTCHIHNENNISASILCTLFGHQLTTTHVREISHNVYSESPKCVQSEYECTYCTRSSCDYIENRLIYSVRISTCHG